MPPTTPSDSSTVPLQALHQALARLRASSRRGDLPFNAPNPVELLRTGLALPGAVLTDQGGTMRELAAAAPDVLGRPLSAPLWILNEMAKRDAAGRANVAANTVGMPQVGAFAPLAGAIANYGAGWFGTRPPGTSEDNPFVDQMHQMGWNQSGSEALIGMLPDHLRQMADVATAMPSPAGVPSMADARQVANFLTGPSGADVGTSVVSGMAVDAQAKALAEATAGIRAWMGEAARSTSLGRRVAGQAVSMGGVPDRIVPNQAGAFDPYLAGPRPENPREALRQGVASMAAERERLAGRSEALATEGERTLTQGMQQPGPVQDAKNAVRGAVGKPPVAYGTSRQTTAPVNPTEFHDPRYAGPRPTPMTPVERGKQLEYYAERAGQYPGEGIDALQLTPQDAQHAKRLWAQGQDPVHFLSGLPYLGHRPEEISAFLRRSMHGDNWRMGLAAMERDGILTPRERSFLEQSSQVTQESMPAEKRMAGLLPEELHHQVEAAAAEATSAVVRLRNAIQDLPRRAGPDEIRGLLEADPGLASLHETHPEIAQRALSGQMSSEQLLHFMREMSLRQRYEEAVQAIQKYEQAGKYQVLRGLRPLEPGEQVSEGALRSVFAADRQIQDRSRDLVRFVPREQVPAAQKARRGSPKAGYASDTELESGRSVPATTTTHGARAEIRADTKIREPIKPMPEGIRSVGQQHAAKVSRARFVNWVADAFGTSEASPLTHVPLSRLPGVTEGMMPEQAAKIGGAQVPKDVYDAVNRVFQVLDHSSKPGVRAAIDRGLRRSLQIEKRYLTASIRFITRNRMAEWIYMMLDGSPPWRSLELAHQVTDPSMEHVFLPPEIRRLARNGETTYGELRQTGARVGVGFDENTLGSEVGVPAWGRVLPQLADEPTALGKARVTARKAIAPVRDVFKAHASANVSGESINRWNLWLDKYLHRGMDPMAARMDAGRVLFDYLPEFYTPAQNEARKWVTWWAWMQNNAAFAARIAFTKPGTLSAIGNVPREWNLQQGYSPEEMQWVSRAYLSRYGLVLPDAPNQPPGTKRVMDLSPLSITDPAEYFTAPDVEPGTEPWKAWGEYLFLQMFNTLRPDVPATVGLVFGVDPQTGREVQADRTSPEPIGQLPTWVVWLPPDVRDRLGIQVMEDGTPVGPKRIGPILRLAGGAPGQVAGAFSDNPRLQGQFVSWLSGISIDPEAPEAENRAAPGYQSIAEAKGIEGKWIREMMQTTKFTNRIAAREAAKKDKPILLNQDGSFSTERSITVGVDGRFVNLPTIVDGKQRSREEAIQLYRAGKNPPTGTFRTEPEALRAARARSDSLGVARGAEAARLRQGGR